MRTMKHIRQIAVCLLVFSILTFFADIALTFAGASVGWYYSVGLCLTALTVFRILSPASAMPIARIAAHRKRPVDERLPRPTH
jgi:hypothetical protein